MPKNYDVLSKYVPHIIAVLVLAVVLYVRIRLLNVPLERDEGEYAYMGQLLLKGISPFSYAYTMKLPGVSIMYALFMFLFGQTPVGIHTGLLIVNGICIGLVFLLARRLFDQSTALFSCASYAVMSVSNGVNGLFAHATHFVVLFVLTGFLLLLHFIEKRRILPLFMSGLCFGLAFTMKQHAALFLIFAVLYFALRTWRNRTADKKTYLTGSALFLFGMIIPYALIALWMVKTGSFAAFWFWTVQYAREYAATPSLARGWNNFTDYFGEILKSQLPLWLIAGSGCLLLFIRKGNCSDRLFIFGFMLFSFLAICPGLFFRGHYFVMLLPAVTLLAGAGINSIGHRISSLTSVRLAQFFPVVLFAVIITFSLYHEKESLFTRAPDEVSRAVYGANPFPEALLIANYIKSNTAPNDKIAVLGSEPEIYFYADRLSATGHIYMYGLMEQQPYAERMQIQMIREIEEARPKYIVIVNVDMSWLMKKKSIKMVLQWSEQYLANLYDPVGVIDIIGPNTTYYLWENNAAEYTPQTDTFLTVYKRKSVK